MLPYELVCNIDCWIAECRLVRSNASADFAQYAKVFWIQTDDGWWVASLCPARCSLLASEMWGHTSVDIVDGSVRRVDSSIGIVGDTVRSGACRSRIFATSTVDQAAIRFVRASSNTVAAKALIFLQHQKVVEPGVETNASQVLPPQTETGLTGGIFILEALSDCLFVEEGDFETGFPVPIDEVEGMILEGAKDLLLQTVFFVVLAAILGNDRGCGCGSVTAWEGPGVRWCGPEVFHQGCCDPIGTADCRELFCPVSASELSVLVRNQGQRVEMLNKGSD